MFRYFQFKEKLLELLFIIIYYNLLLILYLRRYKIFDTY